MKQTKKELPETKGVVTDRIHHTNLGYAHVPSNGYNDRQRACTHIFNVFCYGPISSSCMPKKTEGIVSRVYKKSFVCFLILDFGFLSEFFLLSSD